MCIRTLRKKIGVRSKYKRYKNFFKDLLKLWDNFKRWSQRGTRLFKHAEYLERLTVRLIAKFKREVGMKTSSNESDG